MNLLLRYVGLILISLALPLLTITPSVAPTNLGLDLLARAMVVPIYCCLAVFLMTSFHPGKLRAKLEATRTPFDDFHLWVAPVMVMLAFLWAGFILIAMLALAGFHKTYPFWFLAIFLGFCGLAIWIAIRVRKAFFLAR